MTCLMASSLRFAGMATPDPTQSPNREPKTVRTRYNTISSTTMEPITESEHESESYMYYDNITQTIQDSVPFHYHHFRNVHHPNQYQHNRKYPQSKNSMPTENSASNSQSAWSDVECGEDTPLLTSTLESKTTKLDGVQENFKQFFLTKTFISILLAFLTVASMVTMLVSLPLYTDAMTVSGSDSYLAITVAMFWLPFFYFGLLLLTKVLINPKTLLVPKSKWSSILFVGMCSSLNALMISYASLPSRTPPYLQSMFTTFQVPYTVIARYFILKKVPTLRHMLCILVLFVGIFIAMEPDIFQMNSSSDGNPILWYWPVIFALGWLPLCIGIVYIEKSSQVSEEQTLVYVTYVQLFMYGFNICFFWTDLIPKFGMAHSVKQFLNSVERGILCFYGADSTCAQVPALGATFILSYCCANMFNYFMIRYCEAVYAVVVMALVTPLGTIFWMLFKSTPVLHWCPVFNLSSVFVLAGLLIMMPAVAMYTYFSIQDDALAENLPTRTTHMKARRAELQKKLPPRSRRATESPQLSAEWDFPRSQWQTRAISKPTSIPGKVKRTRRLQRSQSAPNFIAF